MRTPEQIMCDPGPYKSGTPQGGRGEEREPRQKEERRNGEKLCRSNTITGKPEVFIVAHKGKNPSWHEANQLAHSLTSVSGKLNSGPPKTNLASS